MKNKHIVLLSFFILLFFAQFASAQTGQGSLRWYPWDEGVLKAYNTKKFILVYIFKGRINQIQPMDIGAFANPAAQEMLEKHFIPIRFDAQSEGIVTIGTEHYTQIEWTQKLGIKQFPTILVYDEQLDLIAHGSHFEPPEFVQFLKFITGRYYKYCSFEEYTGKKNY